MDKYLEVPRDVMTVRDEFASRIVAAILINAKIPKHMQELVLYQIIQFAYKAANMAMEERAK